MRQTAYETFTATPNTWANSPSLQVAQSPFRHHHAPWLRSPGRPRQRMDLEMKCNSPRSTHLSDSPNTRASTHLRDSPNIGASAACLLLLIRVTTVAMATAEVVALAV